MILFWDKNIPKTIPKALKSLSIPQGIEWYIMHFPLSDKYPEGGDDRWLSQVGDWGWIVISQDYHFHERDNERYALKQHGVGCFYLWGAEATKWEIMRCFARAYDKIIQVADTMPRPFIFWVSKIGKLTQQPIP